MKLQFITLAIAMIFLMGIASATPITDCQIINQSGVYELQNNISNFGSRGSFCIVVNTVDNVLIEGNNHKILTGVGIYGLDVENSNNITIQNINFYGVNDTSTNTLDLSFGTNVASATNSTFINLSYYGVFNPITIYGNVIPEENITFKNIIAYNCGTPFLYAENEYSGFPDTQGYFKNILIINPVETNYPTNETLVIIDSTLSLMPISFENLTIRKNNGELHYNNFIFNESEGTLLFGGTTFFIKNNLISIDSITHPSLNLSATVKLFNLTFTNPKVLRDGVDCPANICSNLQYSNGVATFDVTGWSNYSLEEQPTVTITQSNLIHGSGAIYEVLSSAGSGLGIFLQMIGSSLPLLLIGLAFVGIILVVAMGITHLIRNSMEKK